MVREKTTSQTNAGHRGRLRRRLETEPLSLADYEVLELALCYALPRRDTKALARELLHRFGDLAAALEASPEELQVLPGFGPALALYWLLLRELMARKELAPLRRRKELSSPTAVARLARTRLAGLAHEEAWLALLDAGNRLMAWERLRTGDPASVPLQPRDILTPALTRKANGIILVHNHPGGHATPSQADTTLTIELQQLAPHMGLRFLDHLILADGDCYSMAEKRLV